MKKITIKPLDFYNNSYLSLISGMIEGKSKDIITDNEEALLALFSDYYCNIDKLENFTSSSLTNDDLKKALLKKFDNSDNYKKELRRIFEFSKCPYCGFKSLEEGIPIEHYLPKSKFEEYSLLGLNLILCCSSCNSRKKDKWGNGERLFLNPYIDDLYNKDFLSLNIIIDNDKYIIDVSINENVNFSKSEKKLLENHFKEFNLINRIQEYLNTVISRTVTTIKRNKSEDRVHEYLEMEYNNYFHDYGKNAILTVLYKYFMDNPDLLNELLEYEYL